MATKAEIHMPTNAQGVEVKKHHEQQQPGTDNTSHTNGDTCATRNDENAIANLKREEIVLIVPSPNPEEGYLIYSLIEKPSSPSSSSPSEKASSSENKTPFSLINTPYHATQLPEDLSPFLVSEGGPPLHLRSSSDPRGRTVHVVVSTHSGLKLASAFYSAVLSPLLEVLGLSVTSPSSSPSTTSNGQYNLTTTQSASSVKEFASSLSPSHPSTVLLLSGDGGVVDLINSFPVPNPPVTLALLPLGTANALFNSLHKNDSSASSSSSLVLALRTLFAGHAQQLPTFRASFSPGSTVVNGGDKVDHLRGAIVASHGFHASLVYESDTPEYRVHGSKRFGMAASELLKLSHAYDCSVSVRRPGSDGLVPLRPNDKFNYVLITLVSNLEKTFTISPDTKPLDGKLRLVYFGDVGGERTMDIMKGAYAEGKHVGMEDVGYEEVEEVRIEVKDGDERWRKVCVDGTIISLGEGGWMSVGMGDRTLAEGQGEGLSVLVG